MCRYIPRVLWCLLVWTVPLFQLTNNCGMVTISALPQTTIPLNTIRKFQQIKVSVSPIFTRVQKKCNLFLKLDRLIFYIEA